MSISEVFRFRNMCAEHLHLHALLTRTHILHQVFWSFHRIHVDVPSCWSFSRCIYISNQLHTHKIGLNFTPRQKIDLITSATMDPPLTIAIKCSRVENCQASAWKRAANCVLWVHMAHPFLQCNCNVHIAMCTQLSILINLAVIRCDIQTKIYEHHHHPYGELEAISFTHCLNISVVRIEVSHIAKMKNVLIVSTSTHTHKHTSNTDYAYPKRNMEETLFDRVHCHAFFSLTRLATCGPNHTVFRYCLYLQIATKMCSFFFFIFIRSYLYFVCHWKVIYKFFFSGGSIFHCTDFFCCFQILHPISFRCLDMKQIFRIGLLEFQRLWKTEEEKKRLIRRWWYGGEILKTKSKHEMLIIFSCPIAIYGTISRKFVSVALLLPFPFLSNVVVAVFLSWFPVIANQFHIG